MAVTVIEDLIEVRYEKVSHKMQYPTNYRHNARLSSARFQFLSLFKACELVRAVVEMPV